MQTGRLLSVAGPGWLLPRTGIQQLTLSSEEHGLSFKSGTDWHIVFDAALLSRVFILADQARHSGRAHTSPLVQPLFFV